MRFFTRLIAFFLAALLVGTVSHATTPRYGRNVPIGQADVRIVKTDFSGSFAFGRLGDINGDGYDDFAIGDWLLRNATNMPSIAIFFGREQWPTDLTFDDADIILNPFRRTYFGREYSIFPGDLDGDGYDDIVVSTGESLSGGEVYVRYGGPSLPSGSYPVREFADLQIVYGTIGYRINFPGDFNGALVCN